jgi:hypothetical protein
VKQIIAGAIFILAFSNAAVFAQTNKDFCSELKFPETQRVMNVNEPVRISVEVGEEFKKYKIKYIWAASGGKITRGQQTSAIELTPGSEDGGNNIFVTVKLDGLPENCLDTNTHSFAVAARNIDRWFDTFGKLPIRDLQASLDNYLVALRNDSTAEGIIALEFDKTETRAKKIKRLNEILAHINFRKFDKSRLKFSISETNEERTRLYVVPQGAAVTRAIPESAVPNIIKGEEIERKMKELFQKK